MGQRRMQSTEPQNGDQSGQRNETADIEDAATGAAVGRPRIGLWLGPLLGVAIYLLVPSLSEEAAGETAASLSHSGRAVLSVAVLMAVLWVTEALPIAVTALIPIVLFPLLTRGEISVSDSTAPYAHELIFLFLGGFVLAQAMQRWGLHRRIALNTIRLVGTRPAAVVGGFMIATAFLSMWVSNTATVVMMLPIALSVIELVRRELGRSDETAVQAQAGSFHFAICLLLGTAYAASIGGIGTLIGTPPNALLAAYLADQFDIEISFVRWMAVGLPLVIVFLPITWLVLTKIVFPIRLREIPGGRGLFRDQLSALGPMSRPEFLVLIVFVLTAVAWVTRPLLLNYLTSRDAAGVSSSPPITDAGIAITAAIVLFAIPVDARRGVFLMSWKDAAKLPWGILILFGGGLSLASALTNTGVTEYIGRLVTGFKDPPIFLLILAVTVAIVFLTELTSNTATTAAFLPILGAVAVGLGISPLLLVVPAAIAASCAFMMPVATPPNAIVFSSGEITIPQMCKAGLWLNFIGIALVVGLMYAVATRVLTFDMH